MKTEKLQKHSRKVVHHLRKLTKPQAVVMLISLVLITTIVIQTVHQKRKHGTSLAPFPVTLETKDPPKIPATKDLPAYEVIAETKKFNTNRIEVYVIEKDPPRLERLAKKLADVRKKQYPEGLYVDMFTSRQVATEYFDRVNNAATTPNQKKQLSSRYVGILIVSKDRPTSFVPLGLTPTELMKYNASKKTK